MPRLLILAFLALTSGLMAAEPVYELEIVVLRISGEMPTRETFEALTKKPEAVDHKFGPMRLVKGKEATFGSLEPIPMPSAYDTKGNVTKSEPGYVGSQASAILLGLKNNLYTLKFKCTHATKKGCHVAGPSDKQILVPTIQIQSIEKNTIEAFLDQWMVLPSPPSQSPRLIYGIRLKKVE